MEKLRGYFLGEFVDDKEHIFRFKIGRRISSSLSGFIAGVVAASVFWLIAILFTLK